MRLPGRGRALVPAAKLKDYLLSDTHATGKSKARFFRAHGYSSTRADLLESGLLRIAKDGEVAEQIASSFGAKYIIDGVLETPSGKAATVRTIWIIEAGDTRPRFVTTYPSSR